MNHQIIRYRYIIIYIYMYIYLCQNQENNRKLEKLAEKTTEK